MRIGLLARRIDPAGGGTERDFMAAVRLLREAGYDLRIYAARTRQTSWEGVPICRVPQGGAGLRTLEVISFGLLSARLARQQGAEIVLSFGRTIDSDLIRYEGGVHRSFLRAARQWQSRAAGAVRAISAYHAAQRWMDRRAMNSPRLAAVAAISGLVAADLSASFGLPRGMTEVIYNGVNLERFRPAADSGDIRLAREALGFGGLPLVIFVGSGFARKGLGFLLRAWPLMRRRAALLVVGRDHMAAFYHNLARRLKVADRVAFLGPRQDVPELMRAAEVLVLPSLFEAFGNVVLEAMASGIAASCSSRCGAAEVLPEKLAPFVIGDPRDSGEIASRLDSLLQAPADFAQVARAAAERFTWQQYRQQMDALIKRVACRSRSSGNATRA